MIFNQTTFLLYSLFYLSFSFYIFATIRCDCPCFEYKSEKKGERQLHIVKSYLKIFVYIYRDNKFGRNGEEDRLYWQIYSTSCNSTLCCFLCHYCSHYYSNIIYVFDQLCFIYSFLRQ